MTERVPDTVMTYDLYSRPDVPLYGSVAALGGTYCVYYQSRERPDGTARVNTVRSGYSADVFSDCPRDMPVIRFDLADNDTFRRATSGAPLTGWARFDKAVEAGVPVAYHTPTGD